MLRPARLSLLVALALALLARAGGAETTVPQVDVASATLRVGDCVPSASPEAAEVSLGPSPGVGGSRIVRREEIAQALRAHDDPVPAVLPEALRVVRKGRKLDVGEIARLVRTALAPKLSRGVTLGAVRPAHAAEVPDGWTRIDAEIPRPPHRTGSVLSVANVTLFEGTDAVWTLSVPIELALSQEASVFDAPRGSHILLVLRRGLVEVTTRGTSGMDADVGDVVSVILAPSGRIVSARLETKDRAVALDSQ